MKLKDDSKWAGLGFPALLGRMPAGVTGAWRRDSVPPTAIWPAEAQALGPVGERRAAEFALGRACARQALEALGVAQPVLRRGREPIWPEGVVGSLSHCPGLGVALTGRLESVAGLGIDTEPVGRVPLTLRDRVACPSERIWLETVGYEALTMLWCAKEAIYKCLAPLARTFLDFQDVRLAIDLEQRTFRIVELAKPEVQIVATGLRGWLEWDERHVIAACALPPARPLFEISV